MNHTVVIPPRRGYSNHGPNAGLTNAPISTSRPPSVVEFLFLRPWHWWFPVRWPSLQNLDCTNACATSSRLFGAVGNNTLRPCTCHTNSSCKREKQVCDHRWVPALSIRHNEPNTKIRPPSNVVLTWAFVHNTDIPCYPWDIGALEVVESLVKRCDLPYHWHQ